ncbi:MAG: TlpA family protein disulfide reductase [Bryobacteraceae bacterium]|nr:TlpA family protein disulfide reductase [Bryobacteraceae bacterium]
MARWAILPEWKIERWLNRPVDWSGIRGSAAMILFFHMRCDGCMRLALPQAEQMYREYAGRGIQIAGVHSAFVGGAAEGIEEFLQAGGYTLPVGLDMEGEGWTPRTMEAWGVEGTPTIVLLDKRGQLRMKKLGHMADARLREALDALLAE